MYSAYTWDCHFYAFPCLLSAGQLWWTCSKRAKLIRAHIQKHKAPPCPTITDFFVQSLDIS